MKMQTKNIFPYGLIGKKIKVIDAYNKSNVSIQGKIVDETKSTIKLEQGNGKVITLLKGEIKFKLIETGTIIIGESIKKRPEERVKG